MSNRFTHRIHEAEMMDAPKVQPNLLFQNLHELDLLNRHFFGHAISLSGIRQLVTNPKKNYHIVDLGCGSGDALKRMALWARKAGLNIKFTGVDLNNDAIDYLHNHCRAFPEITGIARDWREYLLENPQIDIVHCSLFGHHLPDDELEELFGLLQRHVSTGFVINDLHRHPVAYYGVWLLTRGLRGSILSRNDGPRSVMNGFKAGELKVLLHRAGVTDFTIRWKIAFRYLVVAKKITGDHIIKI